MISVASYNIQKSIGTDFRRRPERILAVLGELHADIVALQEVDRRFGARASSLSVKALTEKTDYEPIRFGVRPESLGWHGNVILVRKGVEVFHSRTITLPALEPRGAVMADVRVGDERLRIVGMHLGLVGLWRKRQAQAVLDALDSPADALPTVLMGDLTEWSVNGRCLRHFAADHHVGRPGLSFPSLKPMFSFDRIITSPELAIAESGVHATQKARAASDHLPVWAQVKIAGSVAVAAAQ
jgi:endonuclease/exonuclease/phosphatase family metal-dependent hydrolase